MEYEKFIFSKYKLNRDKGEIDFFYSLDNKIEFVEKLGFDSGEVDWGRVNEDLLDVALFNLHLVLGISYWKTYCPKNIKIQSGSINKDQAAFWNNLYTKGLGEFFYENQIDFRGLVDFPHKDVENNSIEFEFSDRSLVPFGGGKDSLATAEMLREKGKDFDLMSLGDSVIQENTSKLVGEKRIIIQRKLSETLFELNEKGCFNGHVPITSIYSFVAVLVAVLYDYKHIILSNERSASHGNVQYLGEEINHQYSKSFEFEKLFSKYLRDFITPDLEYFSLLRPFSELQIMERFSKHEKYLKVFSSCNRNFHLDEGQRINDRWCCECPKCAFVFSQLASFVSKNELLDIFGKNLYNQEKMLDTYLELLGRKDIKPFECVGTPEEVLSAMCFAKDRGEFDDDFVMKKIQINKKECQAAISETMSISNEHNIPKNFYEIK